MHTYRTIVVLFVIAILSISLSACSGDASTDTLNWMASAYNNGSPASSMSLQLSTRIENCDFSTKAQLGGAVKEATAEITIGEWLDGKMKTTSCITPAKEK